MIGHPACWQPFRERALARFDRKTLYTAGAPGYSDYPPLAS